MGFCKYCKRNDADVYHQPAGVHNDECDKCWALYSAIRDLPSPLRIRDKGNCREALRKAIQAIKVHSPVARQGLQLRVDQMPPHLRNAVSGLRSKLRNHPSRETDDVEPALHCILQEIADLSQCIGAAAPASAPPSNPLIEGNASRELLTRYERDPEARRRCIEVHGTTCSACGLNFGAVYGPVAEGFIHVHHLRPLSEAGGAHAVDPVEDLRPVCPNCHAVLHLRAPVFSIEELRDLLRQQRRT